MENITEVVGLLDDYVKLEKNIGVLKMTKGMTQDILKESEDYRSFLNLQYGLDRLDLNGAEIIEMYKYVKNIAEQNYNFNKEGYEDKIKGLEEVVSNLKDSKNNLRKLILDYNNFFNGKIIDEINNSS